MKDKSIHLRLPKVLYKESLKIKESFGFTNIQEFIKEAIRRLIYEYNKQKALKTLKKLYGSFKNIRRLTRKEKDKLAMELFNNLDEQKNLFKRFGL